MDPELSLNAKTVVNSSVNDRDRKRQLKRLFLISIYSNGEGERLQGRLET